MTKIDESGRKHKTSTPQSEIIPVTPGVYYPRNSKYNCIKLKSTSNKWQSKKNHLFCLRESFFGNLLIYLLSNNKFRFCHVC